MIFEFQNGLVDIVREKPYDGVVTLRSSDREAVALFELMGSGQVLKVPHHLYPWILHLGDGNLPNEVQVEDLANVEVIDRLTPEPAAFAVEWTYRDATGTVQSGTDYCWPQDKDVARLRVSYEHENFTEDIKFIPLFEIPKKLLGLEENDESI